MAADGRSTVAMGSAVIAVSKACHPAADRSCSSTCRFGTLGAPFFVREPKQEQWPPRSTCFAAASVSGSTEKVFEATALGRKPKSCMILDTDGPLPIPHRPGDLIGQWNGRLRAGFEAGEAGGDGGAFHRRFEIEAGIEAGGEVAAERIAGADRVHRLDRQCRHRDRLALRCHGAGAVA